MGVVKTSIFTILDHFPEYRDKIRFLFGLSPGFQALCEDFRQCGEALSYWSQSDRTDAPKRREEYLELKHELEIEIMQFLNGSK